MTILAQHGWGKSNKIERGLASGSIRGVIMSPRDETPGNLASFLSTMGAAFPNSERLVDPQLYAGTIWPVRDGRLQEYPHYQQNLTPTSFSSAAIQDFVTRNLNWQYGLDVSGVVSSSVLVDNLSSQWAQIAMMLAQETSARHNGQKPLLISIVVGENALSQPVMVDRWLDDLTQLEVDGFYLIIRRNLESYRQAYDSDTLTTLLRICYSLGELNQYHLVVGYSDMVTLLLHALGVTGTGAGWFASLKQFTLRRFEPVSGGRRPRPRYSSRPLLNSIYMNELDVIHSAGRVTDVLSGTPFDARFNATTNPENVPWPDDESALNHWHVLDDISRSPVGPTIGDRLDSASNEITQALAVYSQIGNFVPFTTETGSNHLDDWLYALNRFRAEAGV